MAGPHPPGGRAGRAAARRDDPRGEGRPARQPLGRQRHRGSSEAGRRGRHPQRRPDAGRVRGRVGAQPGRGQPRTGWATSPGCTAAGRSPPAEGAAELVRQQRVGHRGVPARRPGARARGVPDRVHHVRRDRLPGRDRLGRHVRPGAGRADGRRDRPGHGRARRAPGPVPGARRGPRLPLGPGRGDHRRGPVPGRDARRRLRPGAAERGRDRHAQALRRLLGLPGRPQPRPGLDGPARAARRDPAAVRDGGRARRRRLGDELLLRRRRRARRRRPVAARPRCCATTGASAARWSPTTGRCRSWPPCTGSRPTPARPARWPSRPASTSSCRTRSASPRGWSSGSAPARSRPSWSTGPPAGCCAQKAELGLLDPDWTPEASVTDAAGIDLDSAANRALAREMAERSVVLLDAGDRAAAARPGPAGAAPGRRRRAVRRRPAHVHGLLRLPQPRAAPPPRARARHRGADRGRRAAGRAARRRGRVRAGLRGAGRRPVRVRRRGRRRPGRRPVRRLRRRPGRAVRPRHLRRGLRRRGPAAARACRPTCSPSCSRPAPRWSWSWSPAGPTRWASVAGRAALVQAFMPGEEGGAAIAGVLSGRLQPGGKLPVQIPRRTGGQPSTYLQPPLGSPESAGISTLDPTPLFPFGYGGSYTTFTVDGPAPRRDRDRHRRRVRRDRAGPQHRRARRRRGRPALPARRAGPGGPAGAAAGRLRPGPAGAGRGRTCGSGCTPTGPRSPAST